MAQKINILLVEDEFITRDNLRECLVDLGYVISGTAMRAEKAIKILEEEKTDLAILDIHLKGDKTGIWIGEQIQKKYHIPFIYLTAFTDAATVKAAATTQPSSYLVKPFTQPSIFAAIEVAINTFQPLLEYGEQLDPRQHIFIKEDKVFKKILLAEIRFIEAFKNYLEINLKDSRHIIRSTMKDFMAQLPTQHFLQTHRSYVVNKHHVKAIAGERLFLSSREVPLTKSYRQGVLQELDVTGLNTDT